MIVFNIKNWCGAALKRSYAAFFIVGPLKLLKDKWLNIDFVSENKLLNYLKNIILPPLFAVIVVYRHSSLPNVNILACFMALMERTLNIG